ncbi:hypothetical protein BOSEA31B_12583 [Hyphomicrobiales bacterium]|nr:hypothetical protein BOSEA31B_12583 [Hyphomicrobiales bacterium]CAH1698352.1 hypothetical protein BOSEA1005_11405 [Hyphomicrobiales bacterium]CAI0342007.1 hypothetical protein BO1005MUT1_150003 [Hyphomicrobiales bacterium]
MRTYDRGGDPAAKRASGRSGRVGRTSRNCCGTERLLLTGAGRLNDPHASYMHYLHNDRQIFYFDYFESGA